MGWASGSYLAEEVWETLKKAKVLPAQKQRRQNLARKLVDLFENQDADDWDTDQKGGLYHTAYPEPRPGDDDYEPDDGEDDDDR